MLTSFKVTGLWGHQEYPFDFHEDLNIITGSNGTGKTTLLKLIWYMLSGHLKQAFLEVNFARAELVTKTAIITRQDIHRSTLPKDIPLRTICLKMGKDAL